METMTHRLIHFTAAACAALTLAGTAHAVDLRSWDQKINDVTKRFIVLPAFNSEAVLDKETQLVWERSPESTLHTWNTARGTCLFRSTGGRMGWRLPTAEELSSLNATSALPSGHPFTIGQPNSFWSATSNPSSSSWAFVKHEPGGTGWYQTVNLYRAWCVRTGQGSDGV